jgi:hypothetical protein
MTDRTDDNRRQIVYGEHWGDSALIIFDESRAVGLAREIEKIELCGTVGEARRLQERLGYTYMPGGIDGFLDEDEEPLPDDAPYNCYDMPEAEDGEWPPMPGSYALDDLPIDLLRLLTARAGGRLIDTTLNGSTFTIPVEREDDLVNTMRSAGYAVRRDDDLINNLGIQ